MRYRAAMLLALTLCVVSCDDMTDQPREGAYTSREGSPEMPPSGTVMVDEPTAAAPPVTEALLERGRERFNIYCDACHGMTGAGNGMVVQRGFPAPPSFQIDRLLQAPPQHFYDVMTDGYGVMYSFAGRILPADRWAIAAYMKALQASQNATIADVPASARAALE